MKVKRVTAPSGDPVDLADLKTYLRIDTDSDNSLLEGFISAATISVEKYLNSKLMTQTWDLFLDRFPAAKMNDSLLSDGVTDGALSEYLSPMKTIDIPFPPLQSVTFFKTIDDAGTEYAFTGYHVDTADQVGRVALRSSDTWPATYLKPVNGIQIRFVCGYGGASDVPFAIKHAIMEIAGIFYNSRGCADSEIPARVWDSLSQYRVYL